MPVLVFFIAIMSAGVTEPASSGDRRPGVEIGTVTVRKHSKLRLNPLARPPRKKVKKRPSPLLTPWEGIRPAKPLSEPDETPQEGSGVEEVPTGESSETPETPEVSEASPPVTFELSGFLLGRLQLVNNDDHARLASLLPGFSRRAFFEVNLQPRMRLKGNVFGAFVDASLYVATSGPSNLFLINEAYLESTLGPVYLLAGRRRVIWGSGLALNPTDIINPIKNPLDVEQQRTGALLLPLVEVVVKKFAFSALFSPGVATTDWALPRRIDFKDSVLAARAYASLLDADWNLMYLKQFEKKRDHLGLSFSRFFGEMVELHLEVRARTGSPDPASLPNLPTCPLPGGLKTKVTATGIVGGRVEWPDQTFISIEYLYWGDGLRPSDYDTVQNALPCISDALRGTPLPTPNFVGHPMDLPLVLLRQHYAFLVFQRAHLAPMKILENINVGLNVTLGLEDGSTVTQAVLGYSFGGIAALRLSGVWWAPGSYGQFALLPARTALFTDVRIFF